MGKHTTKTVIIVGAGASYEFNLPVGNELMHLISRSFTTTEDGLNIRAGQFNDLFRAISEQEGAPKQTELVEAARKIRAGMPYAQSIDNFLHSNKRDEAIIVAGKLAIAQIINNAEVNSTLYKGPIRRNSPSLNAGVEIDDSWLHRLFRILTSNKTFTEFIESLSNITFISFNYDRCIQQFFWNAVGAYFTTIDCAKEEAQYALNIQYVYGSIGDFEFSSEQTSFGNSKLPDLLQAPKSLRTFTEGEQSGIRNIIEDSIIDSRNLIILGFGFHPINMNLIFEGKKFSRKVVLSTAHGMSLSDRAALEKHLLNQFYWKKSSGGFYHNPPNGLLRVNIITASELFHEYSQYLSAMDDEHSRASKFLLNVH